MPEGDTIDFIHILSQYAMLVAGLAAAVTLLRVSAPYGRHFRPGWGPALPSQVAWMTQESPAWLVPLLIAISSNPSSFLANPSSRRTVLLAAFIIHYVHRSLIYPLRVPNNKTTPFTVWFLAFVFCVWNGFLQAWSLVKMQPVEDVGSIVTFCGYVLWLGGFIANIQTDITLTNLRRTQGYGIPRGGLFECVSAANYFAEMIEWFGFALAAQTTSSWVFFVFVLCNLAPRGYTHHKWYKEKFENYPTNRWAVIPFIL